MGVFLSTALVSSTGIFLILTIYCIQMRYYSDMKKALNEHKYKIAIGLPVLFTYLASAHLVSLYPNTLVLSSQEDPFLFVDETITLDLVLDASNKINVIGSTITYPPLGLSVEDIRFDDSPINLWVQEPVTQQELGVISFGGGIVLDEEQGFSGTSTILHVTFKTLKEGISPIQLEGALLLAHDGNGTNVLTRAQNISIYTRGEAYPTPDVNGDGILTLKDVTETYLQTFTEYDHHYDINNDKQISATDVSLLYAMLP